MSGVPESWDQPPSSTHLGAEVVQSGTNVFSRATFQHREDSENQSASTCHVSTSVGDSMVIYNVIELYQSDIEFKSKFKIMGFRHHLPSLAKQDVS